jgi:hypothetical protein
MHKVPIVPVHLAMKPPAARRAAPLVTIGYEEFVHLYNNGWITMYHYGRSYGASIELLLRERAESVGPLKRQIQDAAPLPNAAGMLNEFLVSAGAARPVIEGTALQNLSDADYLYFQLATSPAMKDATPVSVSIKGVGKIARDMTVLYEPEIFDAILQKARTVPAPQLPEKQGFQRALG